MQNLTLLLRTFNKTIWRFGNILSPRSRTSLGRTSDRSEAIWTLSAHLRAASKTLRSYSRITLFVWWWMFLQSKPSKNHPRMQSLHPVQIFQQFHRVAVLSDKYSNKAPIHRSWPLRTWPLQLQQHGHLLPWPLRWLHLCFLHLGNTIHCLDHSHLMQVQWAQTLFHWRGSLSVGLVCLCETATFPWRYGLLSLWTVSCYHNLGWRHFGVR